MGLSVGPFTLRMETCTRGEEVDVIRTCQWCHRESRVTVDRDGFNRWIAGEHIQKVWPELSPEVREQLISGTHPECWDDMWSDEEED